jgi:hypothetical protein
LGVPVIKRLRKKHEEAIREWLVTDQRIEVDYPDETAAIIDKLIDLHGNGSNDINNNEQHQLTTSEINKLTLRKILKKISG